MPDSPEFIVQDGGQSKRERKIMEVSALSQVLYPLVALIIGFVANAITMYVRLESIGAEVKTNQTANIERFVVLQTTTDRAAAQNREDIKDTRSSVDALRSVVIDYIKEGKGK